MATERTGEKKRLTKEPGVDSRYSRRDRSAQRGFVARCCEIRVGAEAGEKRARVSKEEGASLVERVALVAALCASWARHDEPPLTSPLAGSFDSCVCIKSFI